jgi:hypothetical protein
MALDDRTPSAGRFTRWAIMLVLPLILAAAAMPWLLERFRTQRRALPTAPPGLLSRAEPDGAAGPATAPEPPRHPEQASAAEISAARSTQVEAARLQQRNLAGATVLAPRQAITTAGGERVAPFQGFGLSVTSTPAGARVLVGGSEVGETPIVTSVDCEPGREVEVRLERRGYRPERRAVRCRTDALLELSVPLRR